MELHIDRKNLQNSVSRIQSIIEKRTNMPILSSVLLAAGKSELRISATDLELEFQETLDADIKEEGSTAIPGKKFFEILKESRGDTFHIKDKENNWVFLSDGVARFELAGLSAEEFPVFVEPKGVSFVNVECNILSDMISKTIYAITLDEAGFKLGGIFTEKVEKSGESFLRMVSTDGHRLSIIDKYLEGLESLEIGEGVMIPKKGIVEVSKFASEGGKIDIGFSNQTCVIKKDKALMVIRLLETKFPDYRDVIPKKEKSVININRVSFLEAMRRMLILSNERYRAVKIYIGNNKMELESVNPDIGEGKESIDIQYSGDEFEAGFNPRFFVDVLQSMESEIVDVCIIDNTKPCLLKGEADEGFIGLIMPMRL